MKLAHVSTNKCRGKGAPTYPLSAEARLCFTTVVSAISGEPSSRRRGLYVRRSNQMQYKHWRGKLRHGVINHRTDRQASVLLTVHQWVICRLLAKGGLGKRKSINRWLDGIEANRECRALKQPKSRSTAKCTLSNQLVNPIVCPAPYASPLYKLIHWHLWTNLKKNAYALKHRRAATRQIGGGLLALRSPLGVEREGGGVAMHRTPTLKQGATCTHSGSTSSRC